MEYDVLFKLLIERFPVLGFVICLISILMITYTVYLGSKAKRFLLKSKWLGIEIKIENLTPEERSKNTLCKKEEMIELEEQGKNK